MGGIHTQAYILFFIYEVVECHLHQGNVSIALTKVQEAIKHPLNRQTTIGRWSGGRQSKQRLTACYTKVILEYCLGEAAHFSWGLYTHIFPLILAAKRKILHNNTSNEERKVCMLTILQKPQSVKFSGPIFSTILYKLKEKNLKLKAYFEFYGIFPWCKNYL